MDFNAWVKKLYIDWDFDLGYSQFTDPPDPDIGLRGRFVCDNIKKVPFANGGAYCNPTVDGLFTRAASEPDESKRVQMYQEIQRIIVDDQPQIFLVDGIGPVAYDGSFTGYERGAPRAPTTSVRACGGPWAAPPRAAEGRSEMKRLALLAVVVSSLVTAAAPVTARAVTPRVQATPVSFTVVNPGDPGVVRTVRGTLYLPSGATACSGVQILVHGFSYGQWVWDLPGRPDYSYARYSAGRGRPVIAIDDLGYGTSDRPNGYTVTTEGLGAVLHQVVSQVRAGTYQGQIHPAFARIVTGGHSAGGEVARYEAGAFGDVDALMVMSMGNNVTPESSDAYARYNVTQTATSDYVYPFFASQDRRLSFFYQSAEAELSVMAEDARLENPTPSGEVLSILTFPSRAVIARINVPVLLVFAEKDRIVPVSEAATEPARYAGSPRVTTVVVPTAGHTFPLHRNREVAYRALVSWLATLGDAAPPCSA